MITKLLLIAVVVPFVIGFVGTAVFRWTLDTSPYLSGLANFLHVIYYILPMDKLRPIIIAFVAIMGFRIVVSTIKALLDLSRISV